MRPLLCDLEPGTWSAPTLPRKGVAPYRGTPCELNPFIHPSHGQRSFQGRRPASCQAPERGTTARSAAVSCGPVTPFAVTRDPGPTLDRLLEHLPAHGVPGAPKPHGDPARGRCSGVPARRGPQLHDATFGSGPTTSSRPPRGLRRLSIQFWRSMRFTTLELHQVDGAADPFGSWPGRDRPRESNPRPNRITRIGTRPIGTKTPSPR